jgi:hypothetical protein
MEATSRPHRVQSRLETKLLCFDRFIFKAEAAILPMIRQPVIEPLRKFNEFFRQFGLQNKPKRSVTNKLETIASAAPAVKQERAGAGDAPALVI